MPSCQAGWKTSAKNHFETSCLIYFCWTTNKTQNKLCQHVFKDILLEALPYVFLLFQWTFGVKRPSWTSEKKVEVACPQNDSVKNGCQGATMGPLLCGDLWILRLGVAAAVDKFFNLAWKIFLGAGSFFCKFICLFALSCEIWACSERAA